MRSILFVATCVMALVACVATVGAVEAASQGVYGLGCWGLWALVLVLIQLTPDRSLDGHDAVEVAFVAAAAEEANAALAVWPIWEGFVLPEGVTGEIIDDSPVGLVSDGIEIEATLLVARPVFGVVRLTDRQVKSNTQQRVLRAELARKDLSSAELFDLGVALMKARKGLLG